MKYIQGLAKKYAILTMQDPGRLRQAEQVSESRNKLLATTYHLFSRSMYMIMDFGNTQKLTYYFSSLDLC